jgi:hypothetical protein
MAEISVDHIATSMEITDSAAGTPDLARMRAELRAMLTQEMHARDMRDADNGLHDRSWRSDVKPG